MAHGPATNDRAAAMYGHNDILVSDLGDQSVPAAPIRRPVPVHRHGCARCGICGRVALGVMVKGIGTTALPLLG